MMVTKTDIFENIQKYMKHEISIDVLVDWAENMMMEAEFDEEDFETIRNIVSRLGLADRKAFGLSWEDCENIISELGYKVTLQFEYA